LLSWLGPWANAIEQHHERFGGGGYPRSLAGEEISFAARIVSVADSFEVMTASRSYKKPMSVPAARRELAACAGEQFDPAIVRAFLNVSLGRLWWTVGPASWTALLPVLGPMQRAGGQIAAAAKGAAAAIVVGAAGVLPMVSGTAAASPPPSPSRATAAPVASFSPSANQSGDDVRSGGVRPTVGAGDHLDVPKGAGGGSDEDPSGEGTGGGGSGAGGGPPGGGTVDDPAGTVNDVVDGVTDTVETVVNGATDVDGVLGTDLSSVVDEPIEGVTGVLGGLLGR
jgi:hypothetical protein